MPEYMKESEAWREIARRIAEGEWDQEGLCREIGQLHTAGLIDEAREYDMRARLLKHENALHENMGGHDVVLVLNNLRSAGFGYVYIWPIGAPDERVIAALFLACEAEAEGD